MKRLKVFPPLSRVDADLSPGEIVLTEGRVIVGSGNGALALESVQPEGGKRMQAVDYFRGRKPSGFEVTAS